MPFGVTWTKTESFILYSCVQEAYRRGEHIKFHIHELAETAFAFLQKVLENDVNELLLGTKVKMRTIRDARYISNRMSTEKARRQPIVAVTLDEVAEELGQGGAQKAQEIYEHLQISFSQLPDIGTQPPVRRPSRGNYTVIATPNGSSYNSTASNLTPTHYGLRQIQHPQGRHMHLFSPYGTAAGGPSQATYPGRSSQEQQGEYEELATGSANATTSRYGAGSIQQPETEYTQLHPEYRQFVPGPSMAALNEFGAGSRQQLQSQQQQTEHRQLQPGYRQLPGPSMAARNGFWAGSSQQSQTQQPQTEHGQLQPGYRQVVPGPSMAARNVFGAGSSQRAQTQQPQNGNVGQLQPGYRQVVPGPSMAARNEFGAGSSQQSQTQQPQTEHGQLQPGYRQVVPGPNMTARNEFGAGSSQQSQTQQPQSQQPQSQQPQNGNVGQLQPGYRQFVPRHTIAARNEVEAGSSQRPQSQQPQRQRPQRQRPQSQQPQRQRPQTEHGRSPPNHITQDSTQSFLNTLPWEPTPLPITSEDIANFTRNFGIEYTPDAAGRYIFPGSTFWHFDDSGFALEMAIKDDGEAEYRYYPDRNDMLQWETVPFRAIQHRLDPDKVKHYWEFLYMSRLPLDVEVPSNNN